MTSYILQYITMYPIRLVSLGVSNIDAYFNSCNFDVTRFGVTLLQLIFTETCNILLCDHLRKWQILDVTLETVFLC